NSVNVEINLNDTAIEFPHYWKSTGFTPASAVQLPAMQLSLDLLSTQAGQGVVYVRPHYLLNLVGTKGLGTENPEYNWTKLDFVLDYFVENNLIPFFEIMGHPSTEWEAQDQEFDQYFQGQNSDENRYFDNFEDDGQIRAWKELVKEMALHFIERYGPEEVRSWYFETWNEPNLNHFWHYGLQGLLNYYDACSEGLMEADSLLIFGGPGTAGAPDNDTFKELLNHCESGTNYFTGEKGVRIDFISYHIKARVRYMINNELEVIEYIRENNPGLKDLPLINNEADPIAGWGRKFFWRPDAWYASFIVQSIDHHNIYLIDDKGVNYGMLSNDNGFMGDWYRRTHFARFIKDNDDQLSRSEQFYLIKKPAFTVMSLLELLGNERFRVNLDNREKHYGLIPTRNNRGDIILALYNSPLIEISYNRPVSIEKEYVDKLIYENSDVRFKINLNGIIPGKYILIHYSLDEEHSNPFAEWLKAGSPEFPGTKEYHQMAARQEPQIIGIPTELNLNSPNAEIEIDMSPASVSLIMLVQKT
ncbi:MAG: hypothetical protein IH594_07895, partial [Bacteroidales bacterium]|nr:hypothetical protein [Bacteroidales bacterium]